jgi:predicted secreted Zn-dependent protease
MGMRPAYRLLLAAAFLVIFAAEWTLFRPRRREEPPPRRKAAPASLEPAPVPPERPPERPEPLDLIAPSEEAPPAAPAARPRDSVEPRAEAAAAPATAVPPAQSGPIGGPPSMPRLKTRPVSLEPTSITPTPILSRVRLPWASQRPVRVELPTHQPPAGGTGAFAFSRGVMEPSDACFRTATASTILFSSQLREYDVAGANASEAEASMLANRPSSMHDAVGLTTATMGFSHDGCVQDEQGYRLKGMRVSLEIVIDVPRLAASASGRFARNWARFRDCVEQHEHTHEAYNIEYAERFQSQAASLPPAASCDDVSEQLQRLFEGTMTDLQARHASFDATAKPSQPCACRL